LDNPQQYLKGERAKEKTVVLAKHNQLKVPQKIYLKVIIQVNLKSQDEKKTLPGRILTIFHNIFQQARNVDNLLIVKRCCHTKA